MDFEEQIKNFPKQFEWEPKIENKENLPKKWGDVLVCGMGGSALPGLLLQSLLKNRRIDVHRDYNLPTNTSKNTLVAVISYSGNTEEALSAYKSAKEQNLKLVTIASGGELEKLAKKDNVSFVKIPAGIQPRIAMGYQFVALLALIEEKMPTHINVDTQKAEKEAKKLAKKINKSIPLFYAAEKNKALAYIAKIQVNEDAKRHAFYNVFPELNHNEFEAYENEQRTPQSGGAAAGQATNNEQTLIILKDASDNERVQRRMELTAKIIKQKGYNIETVDITGDNWYNKTIYSILFTNWLAYYLAINAGVDPEPVDLIEEFKRSLRER